MSTPPRQLGPFVLGPQFHATPHFNLYRATGPDGEVCLKVSRSPFGQRVILEQALWFQRVRHPHVARLYNASPDGRWLATYWVEGEPLAAWLARQEPEVWLTFTLECLEGLRGMHGAKVLHGDISPTNILIARGGHPVFVDPLSSEMAGTLGFVAPECMAREQGTFAADIFSLAATIYGCLVPAEFRRQAMASLGFVPALPLSTWHPDIPESLDRALSAMLSPQPTQRPRLSAIIRLLATAEAPARPSALVGQATARMALRQSLRKGWHRPEVIVLFGPEGSGRASLLREVYNLARSGRFKDASTGSLPTDGTPAVVYKAALTAAAVQQASRFLRGTNPGLFLIRSDRPSAALSELGATHLSPAQLPLQAVQRLANVHGMDTRQATQLWRDTGGHPAAVQLRLNPDAELPRQTQQVLDAIGDVPGTLDEVSRASAQPEHKVVESSTLLRAAGRVDCDPIGRVVKAVPPVG